MIDAIEETLARWDYNERRFREERLLVVNRIHPDLSPTEVDWKLRKEKGYQQNFTSIADNDGECVYVIGGKHPPYKVGVCAGGTVQGRLKSLQTGSSVKLSVLKVWKCSKAYEVEKIIHRALSKFRVNGEWFMVELSVIEAAYPATCNQPEFKL